MNNILCITTYPPRECGIATFSADLIRTILYKFGNSYSFKVCALESDSEKHIYSDKVKYTLNTSDANDYAVIGRKINQDADTNLVLIQHEFGLYKEHEDEFLQFVKSITKPIVIVFHTVLPESCYFVKELSPGVGCGL